MPTDKTEAGPSITALVAPVPPFCCENPTTWVAICSDVTTDATWFNHALVGLDEETVGGLVL